MPVLPDGPVLPAEPLEVFDGFTTVDLRRRGARSSVYTALEDATGRRVALKVLHPHGVSEPEREAFAREISVLAALSTHPHIVTLYEVRQLADGRALLVLEYCPARLVAGAGAHQAMAAPAAVAIAIKLAGAVESAHAGGVLHRNIHPGAVLVTEFGEPALSGFELASLAKPATPAGARGGTGAGVLPEFPGMHIAPEVLLGGAASPATDVYGLASTLYALISGVDPLPSFAGESVAAKALRVLSETPPPLAGEQVPFELADLLAWALAKEPEHRPPSMGWFAEELARIEQHARWPRTQRYVQEPALITEPGAPARHTRSREL